MTYWYSRSIDIQILWALVAVTCTYFITMGPQTVHTKALIKAMQQKLNLHTLKAQLKLS